MSRRRKIQRHYEPRLDEDRESYDVLDWSSASSQLARFEVLAENVPLDGASLLDVGSGLGDLWKFLVSQHVHVRYTGVDLLEKMVAESRRRCPGVNFVVADIFAGQDVEGQPFDVVFCSGAFNLDLGNNPEFLGRAVARFFQLSNRWVVFNLLHRRARKPYSSRAYYYTEPQEALELLDPAVCDVRVVDDYLHNDFTVICEKKGRIPP